MAATILSILLAFFKAIPALQEIWDQIVAAYVSTQLARMRQENRAAIVQAIATLDQRVIEQALGSSSAGKPSGDPGAVIVPSLPGVPPSGPKP